MAENLQQLLEIQNSFIDELVCFSLSLQCPSHPLPPRLYAENHAKVPQTGATRRISISAPRQGERRQGKSEEHPVLPVQRLSHPREAQTRSSAIRLCRFIGRHVASEKALLFDYHRPGPGWYTPSSLLKPRLLLIPIQTDQEESLLLTTQEGEYIIKLKSRQDRDAYLATFNEIRSVPFLFLLINVRSNSSTPLGAWPISYPRTPFGNRGPLRTKTRTTAGSQVSRPPLKAKKRRRGAMANSKACSPPGLAA